MKNQMLKRVLCWLLVVCMVLPFVPAASAATVSWKKVDREITLDLSDDRKVQTEGAEARDASEMVRVSIVLEGASTVEAGYSTMGIGQNAEAMAYSANLQAVQKRMEKTISAQVLDGRALDVVWNMTLIGNIISAWVPCGKLDEIAAIPGVKTVAMEAQYEPCVAEVNEDVDPNTYASSGMIGSGVLWNGGYTGAGSRIAIVDTGTDTDHQSFDNGAYLYALQQNAAAKGMSYDEYAASLDLMTAEEIAEVLPNLHIYKLDPTLEASDLYISEKLPFGYNYVDGNFNVVHDNDYQGEHGSHVAGIAAANRYIPTGSGSYADAAETVLMQGVAPDAQIITMKVFGEESPFDSDYMTAIEDAILLGCDVVNLSLGTTSPGSPYTDVYSDLMEMMTETDTVVVISAGNNSSWAAAALHGYSYADDVATDTIGSPGSYGNAFTVASVQNNGAMEYFLSVGDIQAVYGETTGYGNTPLSNLDTSLDLSGTEYDYVFLEGLGYEEEYEGVDVAGKIVFVSRGTLNFAVKANTALGLGAAGVVIYNNTDGLNYMDLTGLSYAAPVVSITQADAAAIKAASEDKGSYYTGKLTVYGKMRLTTSDAEYYTMSDFSSWGVPGDLSLKPEITAPGGLIYSLWGSNPVTGGGSDQYETMSGTSMAAPQIAGMSALLAQYYKENGMAEKSGLSARHLAQSLLMSTAEPLFEEASGGNYYSLLTQGAGLARVDLAAAAESYVLVEGQDDGKVKAELGDDPDRTGVYTFDFTITNMSDTEQTYALEADAFRQDVFEYRQGSNVWLLDTWTTGLEVNTTFAADVALGSSGDMDCDLNGDGITNAADADYLLEYVVGNVTELYANGDLSGDGQINSYDAHLLLARLGGSTVTVPAGETVTVTVELALTDAAKAELDAENPNGAFVQAFIYARSVADAEGNIGTTHSIPMLAFYGNWSDPSMFDRGTLLDLIYLQSNVAPYLYYYVGPYGNTVSIDYGDGVEYYFGGNPVVDDTAYLPERNAMSSVDGSKLVEQTFSLIRSMGAARVQITNAETGEVYMERLLGESYPAFYNSSYSTWEGAWQYAALNWAGTDAASQPLAEGTKVDVSVTAVPEYYRNADGSYPFDGLGEGCTLTTSLTIDNSAPEATDIDLSALDSGILSVTAKDNEYVAAVALLNSSGTKMLTVLSPNQTERSEEVTVDLDISNVYGNDFLVAVYDYARNVTVYEVELNLGNVDRPYFTAVDYSNGVYVGLDENAKVTEIADVGLPVTVRAAEYAEGYVFVITQDGVLCVADDEDLYTTTRIAKLDEKNEWLLDSFADMAYNRADGKMYALFYSALNDSECPYLCTIDLNDGTMDVLGLMPEDVHTLAIDGNGRFYSAAWNSPSLYTYTVGQAIGGGEMTYIGEMSYYGTQIACSMAWDHNTNQLYFAYPSTLLCIDTKTAAPTQVGAYYTNQLVGLYIRTPSEEASPFDPTDSVERIELSLTDTRVLVNNSLTIEATVWPWNASDRTVTWTSSDETIATVDQNGIITAHAMGECTITAISNLDPSVSASCAIETFEMEKTLNGLVWDENGEIWMSEFSTATLPEYTKLSDAGIGNDLASATIGQDGSIYAASLNVNTLKSDLYKLDAATYEPTKIGSSTDGYVDLAPAPGQPGDSLMAVYGGNVMQVDATTGDYYNWYNMFSYNLVGLAYVGTDENYTDWGFDTQVDWYFIIDRVGYVYLMGFLEQDGSYYYLLHDQLAPDGVYTELGFSMDTPYFGSAYFDGEMLYFSAYKESRDNVTLMAVDVAGGSKACYTIGTFADKVWPVAGLMELGKTPENHIDLILENEAVETNAQPIAAEKQTTLTGIRDDKAEGTLNSTVAPMSNTEVKDELVYVNVTLPADATNGRMSVTFDPNELELTDVEGLTEASAYAVDEVSVYDTSVELAFASAGMMPADQTVVRLAFVPKAEGLIDVTVHTHELNDEAYWSSETLTLELSHDCPSKDFVDVNLGDWWHEATDYVVAKGYMKGMDATHFGPSLTMNRAQFVTVLYRMEGEPTVNNTGVFTDVPAGQFYTEAAYWALETGITTGTGDGTTFNPNGELTRTELVAFMYRYAKLKGHDTTTGDLSAYRDADQVLSFAVDAWSWAVKHGIVTGVTSDTLAPMNLTNRAQAATIFQRFDETFQ